MRAVSAAEDAKSRRPEIKKLWGDQEAVGRAKEKRGGKEKRKRTRLTEIDWTNREGKQRP